MALATFYFYIGNEENCVTRVTSTRPLRVPLRSYLFSLLLSARAFLSRGARGKASVRIACTVHTVISTPEPFAMKPLRARLLGTGADLFRSFQEWDTVRLRQHRLIRSSHSFRSTHRGKLLYRTKRVTRPPVCHAAAALGGAASRHARTRLFPR